MGLLEFVFDALPPHRRLARREEHDHPLALDCLEMALWTRRREGASGFVGLTHEADAGSV